VVPGAECTFIVLAKAAGDGKPGASYVDESAIERDMIPRSGGGGDCS
jgi:hypothetical protein